MVNKYSNLENFFLTYLEHADVAMLDRLKQFRLEWAVKKIDSNSSNLDFLSGITIGEQTIRFSQLDESKLANDVLRVDVNTIQADLYRVEGIVKEWKVSSNAYNQILLFLIRKILLENIDVDYIKEVYCVIGYKMVTSLISHTFNYPLDPRLGAVLAEKMSGKFILKELGSWQKYFEYRATFLYPNTDHANRLINDYNTEISIRVINDLQTNIRSTFYRLYSLIVELSESDLSIDNTTITKMEGEEIVISDLSNSMSRYSKIAIESIHNSDFVNDNYVYLIGEVSSNLNTTVFKTMLTNVYQNSLEDFTFIDSLIDDIVKHSISYMMRVGSIESMSNNIIDVLRRLKAYYSSSKVSDPNITSIKDRCMVLVEKNTSVKTSWILTSLNINLILYIILTSLIKGK